MAITEFGTTWNVGEYKIEYYKQYDELRIDNTRTKDWWLLGNRFKEILFSGYMEVFGESKERKIVCCENQGHAFVRTFTRYVEENNFPIELWETFCMFASFLWNQKRIKSKP